MTGGLALNHFALKGAWSASSESITPEGSGASITGDGAGGQGVPGAHLGRQRPPPGTRAARRPAVAEPPTPARTSRTAWSRSPAQRLYSLISFPAAQQFTFTVQLPPGVSAYDFTFG